MADAIRTRCLKCTKTIRAMDKESWTNCTSEREVLTLAGQLRLWWVHGRKCTTCPEGGLHNPAYDYL